MAWTEVFRFTSAVPRSRSKAGLRGEDGASWLTGDTAPSMLQGKMGDFYVRSNGDFFQKIVPYFGHPPTWVKMGSLKGPPGERGERGKDGALGPMAAGSSSSSSSSSSLSGAVPHEPGGRLTLESGVAASTTDQTAKANVYYTPYKGDLVPIYGGSTWTEHTFAELTLALDSDSGHTGYHQSGKNFDLFVFNDSGTIRLGTGPAWTNAITRADAVSLKNGITTNTSSIVLRFGSASGNTVTVGANQATNVGMMQTTANGQVEDSGARGFAIACKRFLWNRYNRVRRRMVVVEEDAGSGWVVSSTTDWEAWHGSAGLRAEFVQGENDEPVHLYFIGWATGGGTGTNVNIGIDLDGAIANDADISVPFAPTAALATSIFACHSIYDNFPGIGYHYLQLVQKCADNVSCKYYGNASIAGTQAGAKGWVMG